MLPSWKIRDSSAGWVLTRLTVCETGSSIESLSNQRAPLPLWIALGVLLPLGSFISSCECVRGPLWKCGWTCCGDCFSQVTVKPTSNHKRPFPVKRTEGTQREEDAALRLVLCTSWFLLHPRWLHPPLDLDSFYVCARTSRPGGG